MRLDEMSNNIYAFWFSGVHNFGDALNPFIIGALSGKNVIRVPRDDISKVAKKRGVPVYVCVGSILRFVREHAKYCTVWGAGYGSPKSRVFDYQDGSIRAVRGPITRKRLLSQGKSCPEVYGDPAIVLPRLYYPTVNKKYKIGLMPHYIDKKNAWVHSYKNDNDILIIDVQDDVLKVIRDMLSCEVILSSSLHGLIVADAYEIPSLWIKLSDKVKGEGYKFRDYYKSICDPCRKPEEIVKTSNIYKVLENAERHNILSDVVDQLMDACPFCETII